MTVISRVNVRVKYISLSCIVMSVYRYGCSCALLKAIMLVCWDQQKCQSENDIGERVYICKQKANRSGKARGTANDTDLVAPFIEHLIDEEQDQAQADHKAGVPEQAFVIVRDFKIDFSDGHQDNQECIQYPKIRAEIIYLREPDVLNQPDQDRDAKQDQKTPLLFFEQAPGAKL